jgi:hypothetical protein
VDDDVIRWERVRRLTFVPFLHDGRCALVPAGDGLVLPSGEVLAGEDPMLDTGLRVPLATAGFRRQGFHPFAVSGDHVVVWCEGDDGYRGARPHAEVELWKGPAADAARRLRAAGDERAAAIVEAADSARRALDEAGWYRDSQRLLETSYLRDGTPRGGSGFGGTADAWRAHRGHLCQAVDRDGSFLDVGCANGHLLESMVAWCSERGVQLEPYGVDLSAGLVAEARRRLPRWADRIWVGNALDWTAPAAAASTSSTPCSTWCPRPGWPRWSATSSTTWSPRAGGCWPAATSPSPTGPATPTGCYGASASRCTAAPPPPSATAGPTRQRPGSSSPDRGDDLSRQGDGEIGPRGRSGARGRFVASG